MSIELLAVGINGATAALAAACVALIKLTLSNFKERETADRDRSKATSDVQSHTEVNPSVSFDEYELEEVLRSSLPRRLTLLSELALPIEVQPSVLVNGTNLSPTAASIGFTNLELVTRHIMKSHPNDAPYLFGVNRGGALLANLLSQRLGLDQKHLVRCDYRSDWKRVLCEQRRGVTLAIVIDDAVRTGETLAAVRRELSGQYPEAKIYVLALVVSADHSVEHESNSKRLFELVDYYPWVSVHTKTSLPWTGKSSDDASDYIEQEGVNQILARLVSHSKTFTDKGGASS